MHALLEKVCARVDLSQAESAQAFGQIVRGEADVIEISALLIALRSKGETAAEIAGAAQALLAEASAFPLPDYDTMDCCGTGGDGLHSLNISTAVAFVLAALGVPVVKHGNRAVSSQSGSSDVLQALGIHCQLPVELARVALDRYGLCFLHAPHYHPGVRHAMPVRSALKMRTLFNLLGPLLNPARPRLRLLGVYDAKLLEKMAMSLLELGVKRAWVVNGEVDEIALHTKTDIAELKQGEIRLLALTPEQAGVARQPLADLRGGDAPFNAMALRVALQGQGPLAYREAIALNAGAGLLLAAKVKSLSEGVAQVRLALQEGAALSVLENVQQFYARNAVSL